MTAALHLRDLAPYQGPLTAEDDAWLTELSALDPRRYRITLDHDLAQDEWEPLVRREADGSWWAGRYIGSLTSHGRRLIIEPRLGIQVIEPWLDQALGLAAPPTSARHAPSEAFIVRLLARVWCRSLDAATRHGLPLLRLPEPHQGLFVRGRLDVPATALLRGSGRQDVASTTRVRSLNHPAVRAIVCAERALAAALAGQREWRSDRVRQTLPHMRAAVGGRPRLPRVSELLDVRYTPITLPFRRVALLSHRIATRLGYGASGEDGSEEGILIDVAELWELFVLNCTRQAVPSNWRVEHGARSSQTDALLRSRDGEHTMGRLRPDVIIRNETGIVAILDAKYKRLTPTGERPDGVVREDLYQLAAYATRFNPSASAALIYPHDAGEPPVLPAAERLGPWTDGRVSFKFQTLPTDIGHARQALSEQILT